MEHGRDQKQLRPPTARDLTSTIYQQIGFDRSAFASRHKVAEQSKSKESSVCSIHNEGLPEHPIKTLKLWVLETLTPAILQNDRVILAKTLPSRKVTAFAVMSQLS